MKITMDKWVCDECGAENTSQHGSYGGTHAGSGWFDLVKNREGCIGISEKWQLCSVGCLATCVNKIHRNATGKE